MPPAADVEIEPKRKTDWLLTIVLTIVSGLLGMLLVLVTDDPPVVESQAPPLIQTITDVKTVTKTAPPVEVIPEACTRIVKELDTILVNSAKVGVVQSELTNLLSEVAMAVHDGMDPTYVVELKQKIRDQQTELTGVFLKLGQAQYYVDKNKDACS